MRRWPFSRRGTYHFFSLFLFSLLWTPFAAAQQLPDPSNIPEAVKRSRPYRRLEWFYSQRAYPQGYIPAGVRQEALHQLDTMIADEARAAVKISAARGLSLANGTPGAASGLVWSPMGPQPTSDVFENTPVSGRVTAIVVDPSTPSTIYLGSAMGGVWKSTDSGANWTAITDTQPTLAIGSIALDPDNSQNVWVGTGELNFGADNYYGAGILKSTDGGATWHQFGQDTFSGAVATTIGGAKIGGLAILKGSGGQVAIATVQFFQQSTQSFSPHSGIYRTADGGVTWTNVLASAAGDVIAWDPNNASNCASSCIAYATIGSPFNDSTNGFYRSLDSGQTWTKITAGVLPTSTSVGRFAMGLAKNNSANTIKTTIYLGVADVTNGDVLGMYKSLDGGTTWAALASPPNYCPGQCWYDNVIAVVPNNDQVVFAGGAYGDATRTPSTVWRSIDGGTTWAEITKPTGIFFSALHPDVHVLAFSPDNSKLYVGTDGGIYSSSNAPNSATATLSITWTNLNGSATDPTKSLALTQFYPGMSITSANYVFGGTQDNGSQLFSGNLVWNELACGDGGYGVIDPGNANTLYTACNNIDVEKSTTTPPAYGTFNPAQSGINTADVNRTAFIPPLVMDPANSQTLYFGTYRLYQTTNAASTWTAMAAGADLTGGSGHINAIGVGPANTVWVGTSDSKVKVSTNANLGASATFTDRSSGLPTRAVTQVMPDFADATGLTAYVTFSGFDQFAAGGGDGLGYVYKTTNGGANWTNITNNLPHSPVNDIVIDPALANTLYVASDIGVFSTSNGGTTWATLVGGLPRSAVLSLKLHAASRTLVAGTHGRSVWRVIVGSLATIAPTSLPFGTQGFGFTTAPQSVTVTNSGASAITLTSIAITNNPAEFAIASAASGQRSSRIPVCGNGAVLASGATCIVNVTFTPAAAGARTGTLTVTNDGAAPTLAVSLSGTGPTAGAVSLLPNPVAFGNVIVHGAATIPVALSNATAGSVNVGSFTLPAGYSQTNNCPATLNAGSACTVFVTFQPASLTTSSGNLSVLDSGAGSPHTAAVSGTGSNPTLTIARPTRVAHSDTNLVIAGTAAMAPIVFARAGATGTASLSCYGAPDGATCDVQPSTLKLTGALARANVMLRYADSPDVLPPGRYQVQILAQTSSFSSILPISFEVARKPSPDAAGTDAAKSPTPRSSDTPAPASFELSARLLEFAADDRKSDAAAREITLTNLQASPLSVSIDAISGDFVQSNDCASELEAAAACRISVRFKPGSPAASAGTLKINTSAGATTVKLVVTDR